MLPHMATSPFRAVRVFERRLRMGFPGAIAKACARKSRRGSVHAPMWFDRQTWLCAAVAAVFSCAGCGGGGGPSNELTVTSTEGGVLVSDDGRLTLEIPAGAVSSPTTVRVLVGEPSDVPTSAGVDNPVFVYLLEPAGLTLDVPATGTLTLDPVSQVDGAYPLPNVLHLSESGDRLDLIDLAVAVDPGVETLATFALESFSRIVTESTDRGTVAGPDSSIGMVGVPFSVELVANWRDSGGIPAADGTFDRPAISLTRCEDFSDGEIVADDPVIAAVMFVCESEGRARPLVFASKRLVGLGQRPRCHRIGLRHRIDCRPHASPTDVSAIQAIRDDVVIMTLEINSRLYPRSQFGVAEPDECDSDHWHSGDAVFPIKTADNTMAGILGTIDLDDQDGITDPNTGGCGFGKVADVPQQAVVLTTEQWNQFRENHSGLPE